MLSDVTAAGRSIDLTDPADHRSEIGGGVPDEPGHTVAHDLRDGPLLVASTGVPQAMASTSTMLKGSRREIGKSSAAARERRS
jgi:hypothetical protein